MLTFIPVLPPEVEVAEVEVAEVEVAEIEVTEVEAPIPGAPWVLHGEAVAFLVSPTSLRLLVRYSYSPVGPYLEHALATLSWRGPHVFQMSVNLGASLRGGRAIWGFPKTLESLFWQGSPGRTVFRREQQTFRVRAFGPSFPIALPFWAAQQKGQKWVRVPGKISGRARLGFRGPQLAFVLGAFEMTIEPPQ